MNSFYVLHIINDESQQFQTESITYYQTDYSS